MQIANQPQSRRRWDPNPKGMDTRLVATTGPRVSQLLSTVVGLFTLASLAPRSSSLLELDLAGSVLANFAEFDV